MSISDRLAAITARADRATEGPWEAREDDRVPGISHINVPGSMHSTAWPNNAEFIAASRVDVPWLVEQVRKRDAALQAVLDLHRPHPETWKCDECTTAPYSMHSVSWPCPTVRRIDDALGEGA